MDGVADTPMGASHSSVTMRRRRRSELKGSESKWMSSLLDLIPKTKGFQLYREVTIYLNMLLSIYTPTFAEVDAASPNIKDEIEKHKSINANASQISPGTPATFLADYNVKSSTPQL
jgi:hypothetical protein